MSKKVITFNIIFLFLFFQYNNINMAAYSNNTQNHDFKAFDSIYDVDEKKLVADIPNTDIKLYYVQYEEDKGMYRGFILQINDVKKYFNWENVNRNRKPQLILSDLDKDDKDDLIVILNKGYGTGVQDEEVHVIKQELFFYEILVEEPLIPMYKKIKIEKTKEQITIILNNKKTVLNKRGMTALPYQELGAGYGHHVGFEAKNNILYSRILLGVGTNPGVGEFIIKYMYKDEIFQVHSINFIPNTEYLNK
jgi:uncharacterized protein (UPF0248 family)